MTDVVGCAAFPLTVSGAKMDTLFPERREWRVKHSFDIKAAQY